MLTLRNACNSTPITWGRYQHVLRQLPDNSIVHVNYALCLLDHHMHVEAEQQLREACARQPQCCEAWHQHACILFRLGRAAEAAACFRCVDVERRRMRDCAAGRCWS